MKNLVIAILLLIASILTGGKALASVEVHNAWDGTPVVYSMPGWIEIGYYYSALSKYVLAPPAPSLSYQVNGDIIWAFNYAVANNVPFIWGKCYSSSQPPCLYVY